VEVDVGFFAEFFESVGEGALGLMGVVMRWVL
jgi:hypothetical protein